MAFDPSSYGTVYTWIDATIGANVLNASAVAASNNENVDQITDASGNSRHLKQGTDSRRPAFKTNVLNGLSVIEFSGSSEWATLLSSTGIARNVSGLTVAVVYRMMSADTQGGIFQIEDNNFGDRALGYYEGTWALGMQRADGAGTDYRESGTADASLTWYRAIWVLDFAAATGTIYINNSAVLSATSVSTAGVTSNTNSSSDPVIAAGSSGGAYDANIQIAVLVAYQSALNSSTVALLDAALDTNYTNYSTGSNNTSTLGTTPDVAIATYAPTASNASNKTITLPTPVTINLGAYPPGAVVSPPPSVQFRRPKSTKRLLSRR